MRVPFRDKLFGRDGSISAPWHRFFQKLTGQVDDHQLTDTYPYAETSSTVTETTINKIVADQVSLQLNYNQSLKNIINTKIEESDYLKPSPVQKIRYDHSAMINYHGV